MTGDFYKANVELGEDPDNDTIKVEAPCMNPDISAMLSDPATRAEIARQLGINGFNDGIGMTGHVHCKLWDPKTGEVKQEFEQHNLVVTTGKIQLAKQLNAESINAMTHVAIGTSSQSPAVGDTGLVGTEAARVAATKSRPGSVNIVQFVASYAAGVGTNSTINEAGIFDGSSGTVMLARVITSATINKTASDQLDITWTITIG